MKIISPTTLHVATLVGKLFLKITKITIINNNKLFNSFNNLIFFTYIFELPFCNEYIIL